MQNHYTKGQLCVMIHFDYTADEDTDMPLLIIIMKKTVILQLQLFSLNDNSDSSGSYNRIISVHCMDAPALR